MLVERTDLPHFLLTQSEVEDVQVLYHALAAHGLGDDHHIPLVQPAQDDVAHRLAVPGGNGFQDGVVPDVVLSFRKRSPRLVLYAFLTEECVGCLR